MTKEEQIGRLLRPGYTYRLSNFLSNTSFTAHFCKSVQNKWRYDNLRNLNPFEVLQIDPEASIEDAKKKFRRMSIMVRASFTQFHSQVEQNLLSSLRTPSQVHPDKNPNDKERAQVAFDAVKRAW